MAHWNRRVAIVGVGQTQHRSHNHEVNQLEMINEAVRAALQDAQLSPQRYRYERSWQYGTFRRHLPG